MEIKKPENPNNLNESEQKHIPVIEANGGKIIVKVGIIPHIMEKNHFITSIKLFSEGNIIGEKKLNPGDKPEAVFETDKTKNLRALENCNIHGNWESL